MPRNTASAARDTRDTHTSANVPASGLGDAEAHRGPTGDPLLAAKFAIPAVPRTLVRRQRLLDRLTTGTAGPLTLITGPAGAGKTTLAASWVAEGTAPGPVVWLTAEHEDKAPGVFWAYVLEALHHHRIDLPEDPDRPGSADFVEHSLLTRLASGLARRHRPVVFVLDGLDQVPVREVTSALDFVLTHAGQSLRLVVISRVDPLLPLHRYRAQGRICEVRSADLAFTRREATTLLRGHGLESCEESADTLTTRTGGWAAGLRLCALEMQRTDDPNGFARSFAASQSAVADYLLAEVLDTQPETTRDLLMRSSILDRVHPDLANTLTEREDAEWILAGLTRAGAFVESVAGTRWCRFQPLFAEVLRTHLRHHHPGLEPRLRRLAAAWLADHGRLTEALEQAAATADWEWATARMVDDLEIGRLLTGPEAYRLASCFTGMPRDLPGTAPALVAGACAAARYDLAGCRAQLDRAEEHIRTAQAQPSPETQLALSLLRLLSSPGGGDRDRDAVREADRTLDLAGRVPRSRRAEHPEIEALRRYGLARGLLLTGRLGAARTAFAAAADGRTDATDVVRHLSLGQLALLESLRGELNEAEKHARLALATARCRSVPPARRSGIGHLALATVALERGDLRDALHHLDLGSECPDAEHDPVTCTEMLVARAHLNRAQGRGRAALAALEDRPPALPPWPAQRIALADSAIHVARGDPTAAISALHEAGPDASAHVIALARAHLASGDPDRALGLLPAPGDHRDAGITQRVAVLLIRAHAALLAKDTESAHSTLGRALAVARPETLRRPFLEAGPWVRHLLELGPDAAQRHAWLASASAPLVVEQLSVRERQVLEHCAQVMSTEEIAAAMCLSVNTVKTHLRSIYRKLVVSRRGEAVRRARELGLL
ncbi:LuxR C-terminal-related transcriptional regulator [Streptomyces ureilyticus]|uniref:AAA family ATPase n=1 Tax=Streptomyces ureilyticus TaxID=1775131 RepID=A0ABX0DNL5_9ACTN|nr:LuxR C-terminal-related transcriptional regulator [Streptomyces ureilyticus]NGO42329.1 AAA family ATPase [Streptomyces ureilyticus]